MINTRKISSVLSIGRYLTIAFSLFLITIGHTQKNDERPNIVFAFADDWGKYASCYATIKGNPEWQKIVKTPNIDRLAKEGILFNNAYVNAPSCTPSRSSILSGQYFYRTGLGSILLGAVWDSTIPTYPLLLEKNGYHIGYTYKVWSPGTPKNAGYGGDRTKYESGGNLFNRFSQNVNKFMDAGQSMNYSKQQLYDEVSANFLEFLNDNENEKPFCYWFGPTNTHRKWTAGSGKNLWGIDPDELKGKLPPFLPDVEIVREDFADYLGEVMAFDSGLGILIKTLEEKKLMDNTLIVISGDHGIPGFTNGKTNLYDFGTNVSLIAHWPSVIKPGRIVDDFVNLMDLGPTFLEVGNVDIPEVMTGKSLVSLFKSPKKKGFVEKNRNYVITGRERHVHSARTGYLPYPQRSIRTKDFLYIINFEPDRWPMGNSGISNLDFETLANNTTVAYPDFDASPTKAWLIINKELSGNQLFYNYAFGKRPKEELFVINSDPFQVNNVASMSKYGTIKKQLKEKLLSELKRTEDPRVTGNGKSFDNPPYTKTVDLPGWFIPQDEKL
ncbi:sulfatase family protein [Zobellia uliginosa]|uniref:sulfatase family protein n=1 Tax=Zobellia uliginosa TaxID=143224 RepID=UPI0026E4028A|nr:sulfatase [Zobellia uliginosa]MDO6518089.1 sulfatase [Zobellia uliginosa]